MSSRTSSEAGRVDVAEYLSVLRDPADGGTLRIDVDGRLHGSSSGLSYDFVGAFPDLRPGHGAANGGQVGNISGDAASLIQEERAAAAKDHYDKDPCHNYLALDNVPLGRYLRDPAYDHLFADIEFLLEVGSGKGAIATAFREERNLTPFCIDLAYGSLREARRPPLKADGALGSNLSLPLADNCADMVVSYGVVMHTPDPMRCVAELARVLKPGGKLLLVVYNWDSVYRSLFSVASPPLKAVRRLLGPRLGDLVLKLTVFLPYHLALWVVLAAVQRRLSFPKLGESYSQFADFFLTPFIRFFHSAELGTMGELVGLRLLEHETGGWPRNKFSHFAWYEKL